MKKKKIIVKLEEPKRRNPIARILCTQGQFKNKVFKNKKKLIELTDVKEDVRKKRSNKKGSVNGCNHLQTSRPKIRNLEQ